VQRQKIPVYPSQGQLTVIEKSFDITKTSMDKGYIIPNYKQNLQVIGATCRDNGDTNAEIREDDNNFNITQIKLMQENISI
ncbi:FAD-dependent oxidoreductase, partial [Francisella tularensis subsp. holarctica]|nr:FAD-dependent oxidoreductase [Francisella tularensis subsp. holarctica]